MKFFFDNGISYRIARALAVLVEREHEVVSLRDWFADEAVKDEAFLSRLEAEGDWIVVTQDRGRKDGNWHVWLASGLTVVFLKRGWGTKQLPYTRMASKLLGYWEKIVWEIERHPAGTCFFLSTSGRMERIDRPIRRPQKRQR